MVSVERVQNYVTTVKQAGASYKAKRSQQSYHRSLAKLAEEAPLRIAHPSMGTNWPSSNLTLPCYI